jgi:oxygen-independent coproporphyrinogen-3 oxidase
MVNISSKPGIYIHIPFCHTKCDYCDFYSITDMSNRNRFLSSLLKEIRLYADRNSYHEPFDTIYLGGGTPSLLNPDEIINILNVIKENYSIADHVEITLEINPGTVTYDNLRTYYLSGVNRLSIGIQSFIDEELQWLGRIHSAAEAELSFQMAKEAGYQNINLDLIYALPDQTLENWYYTLHKAISYLPAHISAYSIHYAEGTLLGNKVKQGLVKPLGETGEAKFFIQTYKSLVKCGYLNYEISNFALAGGAISKHNFKYWNHISYLAFGPSAHSFWNNKRWANVKSLKKYIECLERNEFPLAFEENLQKKELINEHIFLRLRTFLGINLSYLQLQYDFNFMQNYSDLIKRLVKEKLAKLENNHFKLTHKGMILCDEILPQFSNI